MISKTAALLLTSVVGAVSCATGTEGPLPSSMDEPDAAVRLAQPGAVPAVGEPGSREVGGSYTLDVACADLPVLDLCLVGSKADKDVTYTLPPGTTRSSIVYTIDPHGPDAGGTVDWASADPLDGTVQMHGYAAAFSSVHIEVTGVVVVPGG